MYIFYITSFSLSFLTHVHRTEQLSRKLFGEFESSPKKFSNKFAARTEVCRGRRAVVSASRLAAAVGHPAVAQRYGARRQVRAHRGTTFSALSEQ